MVRALGTRDRSLAMHGRVDGGRHIGDLAPRTVAVLVVFLLFLSTGVQGSSPPAEGPDVLWQAGTESVFDPIVADGVVLLRYADGLFALDADDGSEFWRREFDAWGTPMMKDGVIVVSEDPGGHRFDEYPTLVLDPSNGAERCRWDGRMAVAITEDVVYATEGGFSPEDPQVRAVSSDDGAERWRTDLERVDFRAKPARITFTDDIVVASRIEEVPMGFGGGGGTASGDGSSGRIRIDVFDAEDGSLLWETERGDLDPLRHPSIVDGVGYITRTASSHLWAVEAWDLRSGEREWTAQIEPGYRGVPEVGHGLVLIRDGARMFTHDAGDGRPMWDLDGIHGRLALEGDHVLIAVGDRLVALATDGTRTWSKNISTSGFSGGPYTNGHLVVYLDADENVLALDARSGEVAWRSDGTEDLEDGRFDEPLFDDERLYLRAGGWLYAINGTVEDPSVPAGPPREGPMVGLLLFVVVATVWVVWTGRWREGT